MDECKTFPQGLPQFDVRLTPPDLSRWRAGNTGIAGITSFDGPLPGPHVLLMSLVHGNELAGAIVLAELLDAGLRPLRGRLSFGFANLAAFDRFDATQPTASRYVDEDLNRLWDPPLLAGNRRSVELDRARELRPVVDSADVLIDLHSMLWTSDPLILCGPLSKGRRLAIAMGQPGLLVADSGHVSGRRIIDYGRFINNRAPQAAVLVEAGQHWHPDTVDMTRRSVAGALRHLHMTGPHPALPPPQSAPAPRVAEVTTVVTAATASFQFVQPFKGGDVIAARNTLLAIDGETEVRTPHDNCLLVMPSLRPSRGHTAVRLARMLEA
jgi:predicted deacylase